jgi:quercetin 2,3-dioxygenase
MISVLKSEQRGHANHGWLDSYHTFSFANYYNPKFMGYRALRVINEDVVAPGQGFGAHPHNDMEILTYVLEGALEHKDSMGNTGVIRPGELQHMSAGTGVRHSEYNASKTDPVHLLQIWVLPNKRGVTPAYDQKAFAEVDRRGKLKLLAAGQVNESDAMPIHQDAKIFASLLSQGESVSHTLASGRGAWLQVARGSVSLNGTTLNAGDGAAVEEESKLTVTGASDEPAEVLLFDLA